MRIINPKWSAARQSTDPLKARAKKRKWWQNKVVKGGEYLRETHRYELLEGEAPTGEFREMTGLEARVLNANHKEDFIAEVNRAYPDRPTFKMKRWKWLVDPETTEATKA